MLRSGRFTARGAKAGAGNGPEGSQFAALGALPRTEISRTVLPGGPSRAGRDYRFFESLPLSAVFLSPPPFRSAASFIRSSLISHCCGMLAMLLTA